MRRAGLQGLLLLVIGVFAGVAIGAAPAPGRSAVASAHPLATQAGEDVLRQGGNAFDAAVAVSAVSSFVLAESSRAVGTLFGIVTVTWTVAVSQFVGLSTSQIE